ncbi:rod shape-determining protein MreD [Sedimentitalea sp. HM32M-2]|uniref:rod shape-determining protein MreD n=1 Tax=Sedimentitalea sp. HM32M-2 TaxID=3351566 RepID=UPI0036335896
MDKFSLPHIWAMRLWFLALALLIMFFHLIPLETVPRNWAPPDLLIAFAFAWIMRRPDFVPALSLAAVMLMADLLFLRPPGLLALLAVLGSEYLKNRTAGLSEASFVGEWISVSFVILAMTLLYRLILNLTLVDQAPVILNVIQMILTIAVYPLVVFVTQSVMGVRRPAPGDADVMGARG